MKVLCPACERVAPAASFRAESGGLLIRCARCGAESPLELEPSREPAPPVKPAMVRSATPPSYAAAPPSPPSARVAEPPQRSAPAETGRPVGDSPPSSSGNRVVALRAVTDAVRLAAEAARLPDPFEVPADRCPKCVGDRPEDALSCPHCGLVYVNYVAAELAPSSELTEAFRRALQQWDDPGRHEDVLALATRLGELPAAGRLYRLRLVAAPTDPVAQRGRDEVLRRATAASDVMFRTARVTEPKTPRWQYAALAFLSLGVVVLVAVLLKQMLE